MLENYKIIVVTPAGRRKYLELLIPQIIKLRPYVDEYRLWANTGNQDDLSFMQNISLQYPDFIKVEPLTVKLEGNFSICSFFKNCIDENTIYVRFDDDIVLIDTVEAFINMIKFRINNPQYFLIYGNILNNAIISHIHQRYGNLDFKCGKSGYICMDNIGWKSPFFAENLHIQVLSKKLNSFYMPNWLLHYYERVSINCICWMGSTFAKFNGNVGRDEEEWLSEIKPAEISMMNCIYGNFVCVHYAFFPQREHLDKTNILELYKQKHHKLL